MIKLNVTSEGKIVVSINDNKEELACEEVDLFVHKLKTAQSDAKDVLKLNDKRTKLLKNYNGQGKIVKEATNGHSL
jgi:hypothetical protein